MPNRRDPGEYKTSGGRWASDDDFNKYRHIITDLYYQNNMTLPGIMSAMEREYGFYATAKMYKTRFRRWGLWKHAATASNEPTAVLLPRQAPTRLSGLEAVCRALRDYYDGSFSMRRWQSQITGPAPITKEDKVITSGSETYVRFRTAVTLLERPCVDNNGGKAGDFAQGVRLMRISFAELPGILVRGESPLLPLWLMYITTLFRESSVRDFRPVETQLLRHLCDMTNLPGSRHPTALLWRTLCSDSQEIMTGREHVLMYAAIALEQFTNHLGPFHPWTVDLNGLAIGLIHPNGEGNPNDKTALFRELLRSLEAHEPRYDLRHINTVCVWASHYRYHGAKQGRLDVLEEGVAMLEGVLGDPAKETVINEYVEGAYSVYILLASMSHKLGRLEVAENHIRQALRLARCHWEESGEDNNVFESLNGLEIILRAQGRVIEADNVLVERKLLVRKALEAVGEKEDSAGTESEERQS